MPFPAQTPRPYNRDQIEALKLNQMGCYGLLRDGVFVYVGKGDIRQRLLDHLNGDNTCITLKRPSHWVDVVTPDYDNEEKRLILEYGPSCNKKVG